MKDINLNISDIANILTEQSRQEAWSSHHCDIPMPSIRVLSEIMISLRAVLFPGYFGLSKVTTKNMNYHIAAKLDSITSSLCEQIMCGHCFDCSGDKSGDSICINCEKNAKELCLQFMRRLPEIRRLLSTDVEAAFDGDPAAKTHGETVFCYPSLKALINHRVAHELYNLGVQIIPRIIAEMAHSETGIDIHPGATLGERFFIDHGTGTVIGETCIVGRNVRLYQGVTLGAKSFPKEGSSEQLAKGLARHPIVEDNVIIYAGATILGRVTIGEGSVIGGNTWVTTDIPKKSSVFHKDQPIIKSV